jgi:putative DNA primase/helicase
MNKTQPEILAVENGLLNIITRELKKYSSEVYLTNKLRVKYDPSAKCPEITKFILEVAADQTQRTQMQELIGHTLTRQIETEICLLLLGPGGNGKSIFLTIVKLLLGEKNVSSHSIQKLCYDKFTTIQIKDKYANICADLPHKELLNTGVFKALVSGDPVEGYTKHVQETTTLEPFCKYIFSANHTPPVASEEDCHAWYRRFVFVDFKRIFTPEDSIPRQELLAKLTTPEELNGFLNYALDGYERLHKNGEISNRPSVAEIRLQYIRHSDTAIAYFEDKVNVTDNSSDYVLTHEWHRDYVTYCHERKLKPKTEGAFIQTVKQHLPGAEKTKIRVNPTDRDSSPLSAWRYIKCVPLVPVVPPFPTIGAKIEKNTLVKYSLVEKQVTEAGTHGTAGTQQEVKTPFFNSCYFCGQPIYESDAVTDGFTENKPAHKACYDERTQQLNQNFEEPSQ